MYGGSHFADQRRVIFNSSANHDEISARTAVEIGLFRGILFLPRRSAEHLYSRSNRGNH